MFVRGAAQTSQEYTEMGKLVQLALASVRYGTPADIKTELATVQARMQGLETVGGGRGRPVVFHLGIHSNLVALLWWWLCWCERLNCICVKNFV
jgi:hypothetical protein